MSIDELLEYARANLASSGEVALRHPARRRLARLAARTRSDRVSTLTAALDRAARRGLDLGVAGTLLVLVLPLFAVVVMAIRLDSPGPAFFRCRRVGLGGRPFDMLKFRKMFHGAAGPPLRSDEDDRYTRLGRFLARTRLDELPQLWNVVTGQMSLVGPRPEDPAFVDGDPRSFSEVVKVRPGITGLSQLAFAKEADVLDPHDRMRHYISRILPQKLALDALYVARRSVWINLKILVWTALAFFLDISVHRGTGALSVRRRDPDPVPSGRPRLTVVADAGRPGALDGVNVVVLAGGRPARGPDAVSLLPEPLMPMGDRSVLETIVGQLDALGVRRVNVCLGESAELIRAVFEYRRTTAELIFIDDTQPVGTAGPLRLVSGLDDTFLVINGDVVATLDYAALLEQHKKSGNVLTVAAHERCTRFGYGLLQVDEDGQLRGYREKPEIVSPVSMGVYAMEPRALAFIPRRGPFDLPDLAQALIGANLPVGAYRHDGLWFDVSRRAEYEDALAAWAVGAV
jgi:lipopolysaccharide/colanic/teichoic acid biosynthesis glycosyltransferase/dTDP-glucose pyrophosphorylase